VSAGVSVNVWGWVWVRVYVGVSVNVDVFNDLLLRCIVCKLAFSTCSFSRYAQCYTDNFNLYLWLFAYLHAITHPYTHTHTSNEPLVHR